MRQIKKGGKMATTLVICYIAIALIIFAVGKVTTDPEIYNIFLASAASLLWPLAITCVCILHGIRVAKEASFHNTAERVHNAAKAPG
jgi:hypothetical protein